MEGLDVLERVVERIKELDGTHNFYVPDDEDKRNILEKEKKAEENVLMGMGKGDNQAVKKIIKEKDGCLVFGTDKDFKWPSGPNLIIKSQGEVIGKEIDDEEEIKRLEQKENVLVKGTLVIYKDKMKKKGIKKSGEKPTVVFPSKEFSPLKGMDGIIEPLFGSPCPPAHDYLQKRMEMGQKKEYGTAIVGFDLNKDLK